MPSRRSNQNAARRDRAKTWLVLALASVVVVGVIAVVWRVSSEQDAASASPQQAPTSEAHSTRALPETPSALWIGDSYTAGGGAASAKDGEACLTATKMGWVCNLDAQGGTGFVANGHNNDLSYTPVIGRIPDDVRRFLIDIVFFDVGRNDPPGTAAQVTAPRKAIAAIQAARPEAKIVFIAPYVMDQDLSRTGFSGGSQLTPRR